MALVYITGVSGTGKSTILPELQSYGYEAHGVDEHGFGQWVNKQTGNVENMPEQQEGFDIHNWYATHDWVLNAGKIRELKQKSDEQERTVFLCGIAGGGDDVWDSFDRVFALFADSETIRERLSGRTNNDFGKREEELARVLYWHDSPDVDYRRLGSVMLDARRPVKEIVEDILKQTSEHEQ